MEKILLNELRIEELNGKHLDIIKSFQTDVKELRDFLIEDAWNNQRMSISKTYLWFYKPRNELVGYISLLSDSIGVGGTKLALQFLGKGVEYRALPALKIGRMCIDKRYLRRGIGTKMIQFVLRFAIEISSKVGCRFVVLDAKNDAIHFYKKMDFEILKQRQKGTIPMYYDIINLIKEAKATSTKT